MHSGFQTRKLLFCSTLRKKKNAEKKQRDEHITLGTLSRAVNGCSQYKLVRTTDARFASGFRER